MRQIVLACILAVASVLPTAAATLNELASARVCSRHSSVPARPLGVASS